MQNIIKGYCDFNPVEGSVEIELMGKPGIGIYGCLDSVGKVKAHQGISIYEVIWYSINPPNHVNANLLNIFSKITPRQ